VREIWTLVLVLAIFQPLLTVMFYLTHTHAEPLGGMTRFVLVVDLIILSIAIARKLA